MTQLVIPNVDEALELRLRERAARHGRSVEAELLAIVERALDDETAPKKKLGTAMHELFAPLGGVELPDLRSRVPSAHRPVIFEE